MSRLIAIAAALATLGGAGAQAATTTYPVSVFSSTGGTQSNNLVGNNPSTARYSRNQQAVLNLGAVDISGYTITFNITSVTAATTYIWVRFGRIANGVFTSANGAGLSAPNGTATANFYALLTGPGAVYVPGGAFKASCQSIGGCNAFVFGNSTFSANGSQFFASTVGAAPEPAAWSLMLVAFGAIALRLKSQRAAMAARRLSANAGSVSSRAPITITRSPARAA